ncbi:hypothetical protein JOB18_017546 [Solea senegalensis]|uniref:Uncharacterized protein n=1 Tax=Solea senegalensis TaxID=28829 RepID=A0AAV6SSC6_SOLSE|nr:hypothetical protein JOB18_017546 [Solea senegalensis]
MDQWNKTRKLLSELHCAPGDVEGLGQGSGSNNLLTKPRAQTVTLTLAKQVVLLLHSLLEMVVISLRLSSLGTGHRSSCMRDEQTEAAAAAAAAAAHESEHEFIHGEASRTSAQASPLCAPKRADIYEDVPKVIRIALAFQADATCVMIAFVALQTLPPKPCHYTTPHQFLQFPIYPIDVTKRGEGECM